MKDWTIFLDSSFSVVICESFCLLNRYSSTNTVLPTIVSLKQWCHRDTETGPLPLRLKDKNWGEWLSPLLWIIQQSSLPLSLSRCGSHCVFLSLCFISLCWFSSAPLNFSSRHRETDAQVFEMWKSQKIRGVWNTQTSPSGTNDAAAFKVLRSPFFIIPQAGLNLRCSLN